MEIVLLVGAIAGLLVWANRKSPAEGPLSPPTGPIQIVVPPPPQVVPPPVAGPLAPGVYPSGTVGAFPIQLYARNGDGARICATPGGCTDNSITLWYGPGTRVVFSTQIDWFAVVTGFAYFEGPGGVQTRQNPFVASIDGPGFVRARFAFAGVVQ